MRNKCKFLNTLRAKMVLAFLTFSLLSVIAMALIANYYYTHSVRVDFYNNTREATSQFNYHLDYYFTQIDKSTYSLVHEKLIQDWFIGERSFTNYELDEIDQELRRYVSLNYSEIYSMRLVSKDNRVLTMNQLYEEHGKLNDLFRDQSRLEDQFKIVPTYLYLSDSKYGVPGIKLLKTVYNKEDLQTIGTLVIELSIAEIRNTLQRTNLGQNGEFAIVSSDGTVIYHANKEWIGHPWHETGLSEIDLGVEGRAFTQKWNNQDRIVAIRESSITGWKLIAMVPFSEVASGLKSANSSVVIVVLLICIFAILSFPMISGVFVKPIQELERRMIAVSDGKLEVSLTGNPRLEEFHSLFKNFNYMVGKLKEQMETIAIMKLKEVNLELKQKEAVIKSLQNQINPHLLYNSLDIIKSIAYIRKVPEIVTMSQSLASLYRYSAKFRNQEVTLGQELDILRQYLEIIELRFDETTFTSNILVNEKFYTCNIVKLTLQPIVENAIKHSIEPNGGKGAIYVSVYEESQDVIVEIVDQGKGMTKKTLQFIQNKLDNITQQVEEAHIEHESIGLVNVHTRLLLRYGRSYGLFIDAVDERATVVTIRIPMVRRT